MARPDRRAEALRLLLPRGGGRLAAPSLRHRPPDRRRRRPLVCQCPGRLRQPMAGRRLPRVRRPDRLRLQWRGLFPCGSRRCTNTWPASSTCSPAIAWAFSRSSISASSPAARPASTDASFTLAAIGPRHRWAGGGRARHPVPELRPGVLGIIYTQDLYMTWTTVPFVPLAIYGIVRTFRRDDRAAQGLAGDSAGRPVDGPRARGALGHLPRDRLPGRAACLRPSHARRARPGRPGGGPLPRPGPVSLRLHWPRCTRPGRSPR